MDTPQALSCHSNQPFARSVFDVETLFGPKLFFVLPQGAHSFIGKIINKKTGKEEMKCSLRYKVIVRRCPKYQLKNSKDLQVKCDLDNIWGSQCEFSCKKHEGYLTHSSPVICGDDLNWSGEEPVCFSQCNSTYQTIPNRSETDHLFFSDDNLDNLECDLPVPPMNGKFSCEVNTVETYESAPRTPNGSICRVNCDKQYFMSEHLSEYSVFHCNDGKWNSTMMNFCHRKFN